MDATEDPDSEAIAERLRRAREAYDSPAILQTMVELNIFGWMLWHTRFEVEHPTLGLVDDNELMIASLEVNSASHVLDFSCGVGGFSQQLARKLGCRAYGLNISKEQIAIARQHDRFGVSYDVYDGYTFPYANDTFDGVSSQETFCHIPNKHHILAEVFRVLKPGGKLSVQDWLAGTDDPERRRTYLEPVERAFHITLITRERFAKLMAKVGFVDIEHTDVRSLRGADMSPFYQFDPSKARETPEDALGAAYHEGSFTVGLLAGRKPAP